MKHNPTVQVSILSFGFCLIFIAFNPTQAFLTTRFHSIGFYVLAVVYLSFALSSIYGPLFVAHLGPKRSILLATLVYAEFIASTALPYPVLWFISAFLLGSSAGVLWTAQGVLMNAYCSELPAQRGRLSGIFLAVFKSAHTVGNSLCSLFIALHFAYPAIFLFFSVVCICGGILLSFLHVPSAADESALIAKSNSYLQTIHRLADPNMRQFVLLAAAGCGFAKSFVFASLPLLMRPEIVGVTFAFFGVASIFSGLVFGRLCDHFGRRATMIPSIAGSYLSIFLGLACIFHGSDWLFCVTMFCFGLFINNVEVILYAWFTALFGSDPAPCFAGKWLIESFSMVFCMSVFPSLSPVTQLLITLVVLFFATVIFLKWKDPLAGGAKTHFSRLPQAEGDEVERDSEYGVDGRSDVVEEEGMEQELREDIVMRD
eukprot:GILI01015173.1.p1 GENE.GILI01015173.1~~GILI01015173.1.p1  ORF type:complete len:429 (-),score=55.50 GILI01015173.1:317-1603(-)